jgi:hypothetical protein
MTSIVAKAMSLAEAGDRAEKLRLAALSYLDEDSYEAAVVYALLAIEARLDELGFFAR